MKQYSVVRTQGRPDWGWVEPLAVDCCPWGGEYCPQVKAQIVLEEEVGFHVRMLCGEKNPRAVYTQPDDPVCCDSCMEFFADFAPETGRGYLNLEANARGTVLLGFGPGRAGRRPLRQLDCPLPQLEAFCEKECWGWDALIPLETIEALWGKSSFSPGDMIRANFYKCGDKCETIHYLAWNPVISPQPDYHRPECFGTLVLI